MTIANSKLEGLMSMKQMFENLTKKIKEDEKKNKKAESKKKKHSDVYVSGATSKADIRRLSRLLRQRISEVISSDEDQKMKEIMVNGLQNKIASLDRILRQIERIEREEKEEKRPKAKKGRTEAVYLTSDDLTVNKRNALGFDAVITGGSSLQPNIVLPDIPANVPSVDVAL